MQPVGHGRCPVVSSRSSPAGSDPKSTLDVLISAPRSGRRSCSGGHTGRFRVHRVLSAAASCRKASVRDDAERTQRQRGAVGRPRVACHGWPPRGSCGASVAKHFDCASILAKAGRDASAARQPRRSHPGREDQAQASDALIVTDKERTLSVWLALISLSVPSRVIISRFAAGPYSERGT